MLSHLSKSLWLLGFAVVLLCGLYPGLLWLVGQTAFPFQASGSLLRGPEGRFVGSALIAQPFTRDEYFQPRPSAAGYDASASASSTLAPSNYLLRDRVARALGPIVKYRSGPKAGRLVAPDVERWFELDRYRDNPSIVAQWALAHQGLAQAWVTADAAHARLVGEWATTHPDVVTEWRTANPGTPDPKAPDLAMIFFTTYSKENPGRFPFPGEISSIFFDMWRQEHPDAELDPVPGDMVMSSGSGLDPHITLQNAQYQLDRVAARWAKNTKRDPARVRREIGQILQDKAWAPLHGAVGEKLINVLEVNIELRRRYGAPAH
jgi:potassium-transporting ATPase KdpC subunit